MTVQNGGLTPPRGPDMARRKAISRQRVLFLAATILCAGSGGYPHPPTGRPAEPAVEFVVPATGERVPAPTTDAEALRLLTYAQTWMTQASQGLYLVRRPQGDSVLEAYEKTLQAILGEPPAKQP